MTQPGYNQQQQEEKYATIGGILIIIGAALGFIYGLAFAFWGSVLLVISGFGALCYLPLAFSIIGIIGGVMAVMKKNFAIAIIGGVFAFLSIGYVLGAVLSLVGLILVGVSKQDFEKTQMSSPQNQPQQVPSQQVPSPQPPAPDQKQKQCTDCGNQMRYVDEYDRWYCDSCEEYK